GDRAGRNGFDRGEFADEGDFRGQAVAGLLFHGVLDVPDQRADVGGGGVAAVDDDVGVSRRDLGTAVLQALEAALVDQAAGADAFDLAEYGAGGWFGGQRRGADAAAMDGFGHDASQGTGPA